MGLHKDKPSSLTPEKYSCKVLWLEWLQVKMKLNLDLKFFCGMADKHKGYYLVKMGRSSLIFKVRLSN